MKKIIKIIAILITLIIVSHNICFADMIVDPMLTDKYTVEDEPVVEDEHTLTMVDIMKIIGTVCFTIAILSGLAFNFPSEKKSDANLEEDEKVSKNKKRIYPLGVIGTVAIHLFIELILFLDFEGFWFGFWLPILICFISIAIRKKSEKFSNIALIIAICVIYWNLIVMLNTY